MSIETNKALVVQQFEAFNAGDIDGFANVMAEDAVNHAAVPQSQGRSGARAIATKLRRAFPDMKMVLEDVIAEGSKVVCRVTVTGTHEGPLEFVKFPLPPTGKSFRATHIHVYRVESGKIAEHWAERDDLAMLRQLGVLPEVRS